MTLAQNIKLAYQKAEPSLKRFYLGLFWEKFSVRKGAIIDARLTEEVKELLRKPPTSSSKKYLAPVIGNNPNFSKPIFRFSQYILHFW